MGITEVSNLHHLCIVLLGLWLLSALNWCYPVAYFVALIYLYLVHERYLMRLQRKLQFEERKQANQRRVYERYHMRLHRKLQFEERKQANHRRPWLLMLRNLLHHSQSLGSLWMRRSLLPMPK